MKMLLTTIFLATTFCACSSSDNNNKQPANKDYTLADSIHFDHAIVDNLRKETDSSFTRMVAYVDDLGIDIEIDTLYPDGLLFNHDGQTSAELVLRLKDSFRKRGYFIFRAEQHFGYQPDKIAVLKSGDQFDILKYRRTDGANYSISNDSVINKLKEWNSRFPFEIIGADRDMVEAQFIRKPADMEAFAKEVYTFCPDIVDQGTETVERLAEEMKQSNVLYLWWD